MHGIRHRAQHGRRVRTTGRAPLPSLGRYAIAVLREATQVSRAGYRGWPTITMGEGP